VGWVLERLGEPWTSPLVLRAMLEMVLVGIAAGALGSFVVVRGLAFTGEAFAHTVFPGAVVAAIVGVSIPAGALAFGIASAACVALILRGGRTAPDTAVGIVFLGAFGLGTALLATHPRPGRTLESLLFGSILGVSWTDLAVTGVVAAVVLLGLAALWRPLVLSSFDRAAAAAAGVRLALVDAGLLMLLALAVVVALQAIGSVLVLAMLVTPAATARLLARRFAPMVVLAAGLGVVEGLVGLYVSYYASVAAGGAVVLVATGVFAAALAVAQPLQRRRPA
jgi:manganese/iron transport system permease protein